MKPYFILSVDGGGVRGAIVAHFLHALEGRLEHPLHRVFHLVAGTSTGALVAMGIATCKIKAAGIVQHYNKRNFEKMFPRSFWDRVFSVGQLHPKYDGKGKHAVVCDILGGGMPFRNQSSPRCLVPVFNLRKAHVEVLDSWGKDRLSPDVKACQVASAATAAPAYFPAEVLEDDYCIDAGVCQNDPVLLALAAAMEHLEETGQRDRPIYVLSVGTGTWCQPFDGAKVHNWGGLPYGASGTLVDLLMNECQNQQQAKVMLRLWGQGSRLVRVNGSLDETGVDNNLDCSTKKNIYRMRRLGWAWWMRQQEEVLSLFL